MATMMAMFINPILWLQLSENDVSRKFNDENKTRNTSKCPGYVWLLVDDWRENEELFRYDLLIGCPSHFNFVAWFHCPTTIEQQLNRQRQKSLHMMQLQQSSQQQDERHSWTSRHGQQQNYHHQKQQQRRQTDTQHRMKRFLVNHSNSQEQISLLRNATPQYHTNRQSLFRDLHHKEQADAQQYNQVQLLQQQQPLNEEMQQQLKRCQQMSLRIFSHVSYKIVLDDGKKVVKRILSSLTYKKFVEVSKNVDISDELLHEITNDVHSSQHHVQPTKDIYKKTHSIRFHNDAVNNADNQNINNHNINNFESIENIPNNIRNNNNSYSSSNNSRLNNNFNNMHIVDNISSKNDSWSKADEVISNSNNKMATTGNSRKKFILVNEEHVDLIMIFLLGLLVFQLFSLLRVLAYYHNIRRRSRRRQKLTEESYFCRNCCQKKDSNLKSSFIGCFALEFCKKKLWLKVLDLVKILFMLNIAYVVISCCQQVNKFQLNHPTEQTKINKPLTVIKSSCVHNNKNALLHALNEPQYYSKYGFENDVHNEWMVVLPTILSDFFSLYRRNKTNIKYSANFFDYHKIEIFSSNILFESHITNFKKYKTSVKWYIEIEKQKLYGLRVSAIQYLLKQISTIESINLLQFHRNLFLKNKINPANITNLFHNVNNKLSNFQSKFALILQQKQSPNQKFINQAVNRPSSCATFVSENKMCCTCCLVNEKSNKNVGRHKIDVTLHFNIANPKAKCFPNDMFRNIEYKKIKDCNIYNQNNFEDDGKGIDNKKHNKNSNASENENILIAFDCMVCLFLLAVLNIFSMLYRLLIKVTASECKAQTSGKPLEIFVCRYKRDNDKINSNNSTMENASHTASSSNKDWKNISNDLQKNNPNSLNKNESTIPEQINLCKLLKLYQDRKYSGSTEISSILQHLSNNSLPSLSIFSTFTKFNDYSSSDMNNALTQNTQHANFFNPASSASTPPSIIRSSRLSEDLRALFSSNKNVDEILNSNENFYFKCDWGDENSSVSLIKDRLISYHLNLFNKPSLTLPSQSSALANEYGYVSSEIMRITKLSDTTNTQSTLIELLSFASVFIFLFVFFTVMLQISFENLSKFYASKEKTENRNDLIEEAVFIDRNIKWFVLGRFETFAFEVSLSNVLCLFLNVQVEECSHVERRLYDEIVFTISNVVIPGVNYIDDAEGSNPIVHLSNDHHLGNNNHFKFIFYAMSAVFILHCGLLTIFEALRIVPSKQIKMDSSDSIMDIHVSKNGSCCRPKEKILISAKKPEEVELVGTTSNSDVNSSLSLNVNLVSKNCEKLKHDSNYLRDLSTISQTFTETHV
ncbi:hypothetical protein HELRODRAFT_160686 [Helobdella robusta]|uniref:Uncharacterized protein n=1 Tax=Helobdella robusta TaxID=6412 RepID=T1EQL5_HELRO|nr:hypothetical protein HELRODRAFT_160686 [Helobdella robusta]ESO06506.1 hypothetical protein HELRODRAFT_160686 [Helobdella robusta]